MNIKTLIFTVIEMIIKIVILAVLILYIYKGVTGAYDFGYKVFADKPLSANNGRTITVAIAEGADVKDIAAMLEEKGLIEDKNLFIVQEYLSSFHEKEKSGIYDLSTSMTANEMLEIISGEGIEDDEEVNSNNIVEGEEASEDGEETGDDGYITEEGDFEETVEPNAENIVTE